MLGKKPWVYRRELRYIYSNFNLTEWLLPFYYDSPSFVSKSVRQLARVHWFETHVVRIQ